MRSKVQLASAVALAASVFTALFSAQGSGAAVSEIVPGLATIGTPTEFVSRPVIQPLPVVDVDSVAETGERAASLAQLVARQPQPAALNREMRCLAGAIYFEARGESLDGQLAVGRVIVNRAGSGRFPASYCGVVYQPAQFSFVQGGAMPSIRENSRDWREAIAVAQIAEAGSWEGPATEALYFHATRVSPNWRLTRLARVDNHVFYR